MFTHFAAKLVLGTGFLIVASATTLWVAVLGSALAAVGGPMSDIMLLTMIQMNLPSNQIGKVYSLYNTISSGGSGLGLLLAAPLFATLSVPVAITVCALLMLGVGIAGLARFGLQEPPLALVVEPERVAPERVDTSSG